MDVLLRSSKLPRLGWLGLALVLVVAGCDTTGDSLYDPGRVDELPPDPVVASVEPAAQAFAGVDELTITGSNFSTTLSDNLVYFGSLRAEVLDATPTQLTVRAPNLPFVPSLDQSEATYGMKVAVIGAENFSDPIDYTLRAVAVDFAAVEDFLEPFGIGTNDAGVLFMSLFSSSRSIGIWRVEADGTSSQAIESTFQWADLAFGPDGLLYGARNLRAIFRFPEGGGSPEAWAVIDDRSVRISDLTFDANGTLWAGGPNPNVYRITPEGVVTEIAFPGPTTALATFDGALYAATADGPSSVIYRAPITAEGLGTPERYFNFSDEIGEVAEALAFGADGSLLVGSAGANPLTRIAPDGMAAPLYPGVLSAPALDFAWSTGASLYVRQGAEGDTAPKIIRVTTPFEGAR